MATSREKDATRVAQNFMATHSSKPLVGDGRWGSYTHSAYLKLPDGAKRAVDTVLASFGTDVPRLRAVFAADKISDPNSKQVAIAERATLSSEMNDMMKLVASIAKDEGVPVSTAIPIVWLESKFKPKAVSPTGAKGLFQMTSVATRDVKERGSPSFDLKGREFDPVANATAGLRYIKIVARDLGVSLSDVASIYMGFNIGPSAAKAYKAGNVSDSVSRLINLQAYGPPSVYGKNLANAIANAPTLA